MKTNNILVALLALIVGLALGWFIAGQNAQAPVAVAPGQGNTVVNNIYDYVPAASVNANVYDTQTGGVIGQEQGEAGTCKFVGQGKLICPGFPKEDVANCLYLTANCEGDQECIRVSVQGCLEITPYTKGGPVPNTEPHMLNLRLISDTPTATNRVADHKAFKDYVYVNESGKGDNPDDHIPGRVSIYDIRDPYNPEFIRTIMTGSTSYQDLQMREMDNENFKGDIMVLGNQQTWRWSTIDTLGDRGIVIYDVSDVKESEPTIMGEIYTRNFYNKDPENNEFINVHNVDVFTRNGKTYVLAATIDHWRDKDENGYVYGLLIVDITDPRNPEEVGRWSPDIDGPEGIPIIPGVGEYYGLHQAWASIDGKTAYASFWDYGHVILDISDVTDPKFLGVTPWPEEGAGGAAHTAVPFKGGNYMMTGDEYWNSASGNGTWKIWDIKDIDPNGKQPVLVSEIDKGLMNDSAHHVEIRGNLAYTSNYTEGMRIFDLSDPYNPRLVAESDRSEDHYWTIDVYKNLIITANRQGKDGHDSLQIYRMIPYRLDCALYDPNTEDPLLCVSSVVINDIVNGEPGGNLEVDAVISDPTPGETLSGEITITSPPVTFEKVNFGYDGIEGNPNGPEDEDCISDSVCLTRWDKWPLYNSLEQVPEDVEKDYLNANPTYTEWANGTCNSPTSPFATFIYAVRSIGWFGQLPGNNMCLHLTVENEYYDIEWLTWSSGGSGGGFSYVKTLFVASFPIQSYSGALPASVSLSTAGLVVGETYILKITTNNTNSFTPQVSDSRTFVYNGESEMTF